MNGPGRIAVRRDGRGTHLPAKRSGLHWWRHLAGGLGKNFFSAARRLAVAGWAPLPKASAEVGSIAVSRPLMVEKKKHHGVRVRGCLFVTGVGFGETRARAIVSPVAMVGNKNEQTYSARPARGGVCAPAFLMEGGP